MRHNVNLQVIEQANHLKMLMQRHPNLFPSPPPNVNKSLFLDPTEVVFEPTEMAAANLPAVPQETLNKIRHGKFIDFNSLYAHLERYKINKGYDIVMVMSRGNDA